MSSNEIETNDMDGSQLEEQGPSSGRCSWQGNIGPHHANPVISKRRKWTSQGNKIVGHSMWNYQDRLTYLLRNGWNLVKWLKFGWNLVLSKVLNNYTNFYFFRTGTSWDIGQWILVNIEKYCFVTDGISEQFYFIFNNFATQRIQYFPN